VGDDRLETSRPGIFSAGDVARFPVPVLGGSHRVEHEVHANESGMLAGRNMAGAGEGYDPLPYFYSDVFEVGLEVLGALDGDEVPELHAPAEPEGPGAAIYRDGSRVRGVLLWNRPGRMPRLRRLLRKDPEASSGEVLETLEL
jgi:3-phenylpropionate/trans-cinnamate dioxygenase ferredoxin reductase component